MKSIFTLIFICLLSIQVYSQKNSNTVMVKSIETYGSFAAMDKTLHILEGENEVRSIDLEKHNKRGIPENMVTIKKTLDKYLNDGYTLISSNGISFGGNGVYTIEHTYIFKKENKN